MLAMIFSSFLGMEQLRSPPSRLSSHKEELLKACVLSGLTEEPCGYPCMDYGVAVRI